MYQACLVELLKEKGQIDTDTTNFSKRVLILRTWSLIRTFLAFWVLIGSLFTFQGPYFHFFGFIHAKNVNFLIFAGIGSSLHCYQFFIFTYAYALIFIHRCFGSLFWPLRVLIGSLSQSLGVLTSFGGSDNHGKMI